MFNVSFFLFQKNIKKVTLSPYYLLNMMHHGDEEMEMESLMSGTIGAGATPESAASNLASRRTTHGKLVSNIFALSLFWLGPLEPSSSFTTVTVRK